MEATQPGVVKSRCRRHVTGLGMLLLAGCVATSSRHSPARPQPIGEATFKAVVPPGTTRYQLALGDVASGATLEQLAQPLYPPDLLGSCPTPVQVQALVIVGNSGKVEQVRVAGENTADAVRHQFIAAVRAAALRWQFVPLQVTHWAADAEGNSHPVDSETRPFSLTYLFDFACHAGRPVVSTAPAATP